MTELELDRIDVAGSPRAMGHALGETLRERIHSFAEQRLRASRVYLRERGSDDLDGLLEQGAACLAAVARWDPEGHAEHCATAEAAGIDPARLYTVSNLTDVRDVLLLASPPGEEEGCSAFALPASQSGEAALVVGQTWDLNPGDLDYVIAVHRRPEAAPASWSVTCCGCQTLIGMNDAGLYVGTTNLKARGARPGVGYLSLLHRAIGCRERQSAARLIEEAPRAAAHSYWVADADGCILLECGPDRHVRRDLDAEPLCLTNHCVDPGLAAIEGETGTASSHHRRKRLIEALDGHGHSLADLRALFADRRDAPLSINRYAEDGEGTATNACLLAVPARRELWACRGPADRGRWQQLSFAGDPAEQRQP